MQNQGINILMSSWIAEKNQLEINHTLEWIK